MATFRWRIAWSIGSVVVGSLVVFREGVGIFGQPGMLPAEALDELMDKVRELDMEEVRAEVEKQQEQSAEA